MPYDMRNPEVHNPGDLHMELNKIVTYLSEGEYWHEKAAGECRKMAIRGWGRWHESEAICDAKSRICLEKLLRDKLSFAPEIDMAMVDHASKYIMNGAADFKTHHKLWIEREERLIECLNKAIELSRSVDMELYKELCCLLDEVQNEAMRVRLAHSSLDLGGWNGHDISVKSKWIHEYFEKEYSGGKIDLNIG